MMAFQSSKENGRWTQFLTGRRPHGPYWPRALAVVSRKGQVRLLYHRIDNSWAAVAIDLGEFTQGGSLLTHAALASTEGTPCQKTSTWIVLTQFIRQQASVGHSYLERQAVDISNLNSISRAIRCRECAADVRRTVKRKPLSWEL